MPGARSRTVIQAERPLDRLRGGGRHTVSASACGGQMIPFYDGLLVGWLLVVGAGRSENRQSSRFVMIFSADSRR
jgi:hypothetical protein